MLAIQQLPHHGLEGQDMPLALVQDQHMALALWPWLAACLNKLQLYHHFYIHV